MDKILSTRVSKEIYEAINKLGKSKSFHLRKAISGYLKKNK